VEPAAIAAGSAHPLRSYLSTYGHAWQPTDVRADCVLRASHRHSVNRACHVAGIPLALSLPLLTPALVWHAVWPVAVSLFLTG
jgi:hypothetical protein